MRRPRSGVGAELVPLVLILACLAGSVALVVATHRRAAPVRAPRPPVAAVVAPTPTPGPEPAPSPAPAAVDKPEAPEPEPPPPPPPEDPTPKALAGITSAEAEQLLEASRADRKASALEEARRVAVAESERWRRRESLVHAQLATVESKARKAEAQADELAFERDALLQERDARKAAASRARSRPGQAILPHKGPNGTWRRPIVVECTNGMAILRPKGLGFGLLDLESGFTPSTNPFVAAVAREAFRIGREGSPDGAPVVPYIFFLVRPDGIRPYYEARGRLEPLGITFGYELADADWEVEFPDLGDTATWDGSAPGSPPGASPPPGRPTGASPAEDEPAPAWESPRRGGPEADFQWPGREAIARAEVGGGPRPGRAGGPGTGPRPGPGPRGGADPLLEGLPGLTGGPGEAPGPRRGGAGRSPIAVPGRALDPGPSPGAPDGPGPDLAAAPPGDGPRPGHPESMTPAGPDLGGPPPAADPGSEFVWTARPGAGDRDLGRERPGPEDGPPTPHRGPFSRPLAGGLSLPPGDPTSAGSGAGHPGSPGDGPPARELAGTPGSLRATPTDGPPPRGSSGPGAASGEPPPAGRASGGPERPEPGPGAIIDRRFEIVVVCGTRGVIVQPGGHRVTAAALKGPDGLLKKQMVALVKARRAADPRVTLEPRVRFLVQPGGDKTYWSARGQVLLSGLDWPSTTQVADPDPLAILPSEGW